MSSDGGDVNVNTEQFIDEIRCRRAIWDVSSQEYKDRNIKKNLWIEICLAFYPDFEEYDVREKLNICKQLQDKWKHIRDSYVRSLKNQKTKSGQARKQTKTYVIAEHLQFLTNIKPRPTESSVEDILHDNDHETDNNNGDNAHKNEVSIENDGVGTEHQHVTNEPIENHTQTSATSTIHRRKRKRLEEKLETYIDNYQQPKPQTNEERSDDMDFFRSLLPIITPLTMYQKMTVRINIMKVLLPYTDTPVPQNILPPTSYASNAFLQQSPQFSRHDGQQQYLYTTSQQQQVADEITQKQHSHHYNTLSQPPSILTQLTPQHHPPFQNVSVRNSPPTLTQLPTPSHHQQVADEITQKQHSHHYNTLSQPPSILTQLTPQHHQPFQNVSIRNSPPTLTQLPTPSTDTRPHELHSEQCRRVISPDDSQSLMSPHSQESLLSVGDTSVFSESDFR